MKQPESCYIVMLLMAYVRDMMILAAIKVIVFASVYIIVGVYMQREREREPSRKREIKSKIAIISKGIISMYLSRLLSSLYYIALIKKIERE